MIPGLLGAAHARQPFHAAREPFIFNGAREMAEMLSREVDGKEREREREGVALIEAGEKQVYENRKR